MGEDFECGVLAMAMHAMKELLLCQPGKREGKRPVCIDASRLDALHVEFCGKQCHLTLSQIAMVTLQISIWDREIHPCDESWDDMTLFVFVCIVCVVCSMSIRTGNVGTKSSSSCLERFVMETIYRRMADHAMNDQKAFSSSPTGKDGKAWI